MAVCRGGSAKDRAIDKCLDTFHRFAMEFGWDEAKRRSNLLKHGVDFADLLPAFVDPDRRIVPDRRTDYGEDRYNMFARLYGRLHSITYTMRGPRIWLISARKANQREQRRHASG
jgi:uncharacterized protein